MVTTNLQFSQLPTDFVNVLQDLVCALHALGISPTEQEVANEA